MTQVLGKITAPKLEGPSGPDVMHRIEVPEAWFEEGAHLEVELPQRLVCARCEGGGCDTCGRAGAITLRSSDEPPLVVRVGLPKAPPGGAVVLRVPEGGAPYRPAGAASEGDANERTPRADEGVAKIVRPSETRPPSDAVARLVTFEASHVAGLLAGKSDAASDENTPRGEANEAEAASVVRTAEQHGQAVFPAEDATAEGLPGEQPADAARALGHRGTLYLRVTAASTVSPFVTRAYGVQSAAALSNEERRRLMRRSGLLVGGLLVAFLVLLWLSGWL